MTGEDQLLAGVSGISWKIIDIICRFLKIDLIEIHHKIKNNINEKYFSMWKYDQQKYIYKISKKLEIRVNNCGYSIINHEKTLPSKFLGIHEK